jgi:hypothetical protein
MTVDTSTVERDNVTNMRQVNYRRTGVSHLLQGQHYILAVGEYV